MTPEIQSKRSLSVDGVSHGMNLTCHDDSVKNTKRVKFLPHEDANAVLPPYSIASSDLALDEDEPMMTAESILEQMNQTEKRYLPDDDSASGIRSKKVRSSNDSGISRTATNVGLNQLRKRKHSFGVDEDTQEKNPKFCTCTECYEEAAGSKLLKSPNQQASVRKQSTQVTKDIPDTRGNIASDKRIKTVPHLRKLVDKSSETDDLFILRMDGHSRFR